MADGSFSGGGPSEGGLRRNEIERAEGAGAASQDATPVRWPLKMTAARVSAAPGVAGLLHHEVLHVGHVVAVAGWTWPHIGGEQQADARVVSRRDLRSEVAGGERGGRPAAICCRAAASGERATRCGRISRTHWSCGMAPMADGSVTMRNVLGVCAGGKLGDFGLRERLETRLLQFGDDDRLARMAARNSARRRRPSRCQDSCSWCSYRRSPGRAYSAPTTGSSVAFCWILGTKTCCTSVSAWLRFGMLA